mgnify:CR=1 FL=1
MNIHQLKILLNTSIPGKNEPIELTNSILNVPGTFTSNYPYFSPTMDYPHTQIQDMTYEDRIRFFFNKNTFIKILNKYNQQNNTVDKDIQNKMSQLDTDSDEIYNSLLCTTNFLFTIQSILPTGYISDNHYQSIEFYDPEARTKLYSTKGSRPFILSKLIPRRFKATYSYIKDSNTIYTVDKVTWINDALNHPEYKSIVQSYSSGGNEKEKQLEILNKKKKELENKMEMEYKLFILKILLKTNKYDNYLNIKVNDSDYLIGKRINNAMFAITKELKEGSKEKEKPNSSDYQYYGDLNGLEAILKAIITDTVFKETKLYNHYENKKDDKDFWLASTLLTNQTQIKNNSKYKTIDKVNIFYHFFGENGEYKTIKDRVEKHLYPYFDSYSKFTKARSTLYTSNDISNHKDIMLFGEHVSTFSMKINAIKYKRDNASYTGDMDEKHIKSYLKEEFKNFLSKTQSLESLYNKYYITNPYWKNEIESYINESTGKLDFSEDESNGDASKKGQFEKELKKCYDNNSLCKVSGDYIQGYKYLIVGLDRLKNSKSDANILEAYLYVDVMKGKVTSKNYKAINCTYSNNKLGFHIHELGENPDKNNIDTPFYIDVTDELKKWESKTPKSTRKKKKRGGKIRTRTHKKK